MKCVVLVGGEGTRMRPLTYAVPKQMLPVVEITMIERVLGRLALSGIDEAVLSLGYKPDAFVSAFPGGVVQGVKLTYAVETEPLDTGGAIRFAASEAGIDGIFVAINGDVLTDASLDDLIAFHAKRKAVATVALTPVSDPSAFGVADSDGEGRVRAFIEKPPRGTAPSNLINAGTYVMDASILDAIAPEGRCSLEREVFPALAAAGTLFSYASDAYWLDTGTPDKYLAAHRDLLSGLRGTPPHPQARRRSTPGSPWVIGNAIIEGAVDGHSLVGDAASVVCGGTVEGSTVGARCRVEGGARVVDSVLLPGAVVLGGALVEGSIVGFDAVVGEGASLTGLCVVGAGQRIGSDAVLVGRKVPE